MGPRLAVLVALVVAVTPSVGAGQTFPYKAYVTTNDVYVRSGPGEGYYATGKLKSGAEVEIYRHDPGGWCAIRPPAGSFSWVAARYLKPGKDGLAEVIGDRVAARVGSQINESRDTIGVRLERGETVEVLGSKQIGDGDAKATWYKISPPAGDFRWIDGKLLDSDPSAKGKRQESGESAPRTRSSRKATTPPAKWDPSVNEPAGGSSTSGSRRRAGRGPDLAWPVPPPVKPLTPEQFQTELDNINTELAIMLAEDPTIWNCTELSRRADMLVEQAQTPVQRGHARVLVNRLAHADDVKRRSDALGVVTRDSLRPGGRLTDLSSAPRGNRPPGTEDQYDGVGRLTVVHAAKLGAPRYALVDDQGEMITYITPAPGMNLRYYLGRRIGITGVRGTTAENNADLLTAKHVTMLDSRLR